MLLDQALRDQIIHLTQWPNAGRHMLEHLNNV
jgi:hypothetical protein